MGGKLQGEVQLREGKAGRPAVLRLPFCKMGTWVSHCVGLWLLAEVP